MGQRACGTTTPATELPRTVFVVTGNGILSEHKAKKNVGLRKANLVVSHMKFVSDMKLLQRYLTKWDDSVKRIDLVFNENKVIKGIALAPLKQCALFSRLLTSDGDIHVDRDEENRLVVPKGIEGFITMWPFLSQSYSNSGKFPKELFNNVCLGMCKYDCPASANHLFLDAKYYGFEALQSFMCNGNHLLRNEMQARASIEDEWHGWVGECKVVHRMTVDPFNEFNSASPFRCVNVSQFLLRSMPNPPANHSPEPPAEFLAMP